MSLSQRCSRPCWMGIWAAWSRGWCPCPLWGGWNWMIFKVPANPNHSMILVAFSRGCRRHGFVSHPGEESTQLEVPYSEWVLCTSARLDIGERHLFWLHFRRRKDAPFLIWKTGFAAGFQTPTAKCTDSLSAMPSEGSGFLLYSPWSVCGLSPKAGAVGSQKPFKSSRMLIDLQILEKHSSSDLNYVSVVSSCYIFL